MIQMTLTSNNVLSQALDVMSSKFMPPASDQSTLTIFPAKRDAAKLDTREILSVML